MHWNQTVTRPINITLSNVLQVARITFALAIPTVEGRYIFSGHSTTLPEFAHLISERYPHYKITTKLESFQIYLV